MLLKQDHIVAHEPARPQADWGKRSCYPRCHEAPDLLGHTFGRESAGEAHGDGGGLLFRRGGPGQLGARLREGRPGSAAACDRMYVIPGNHESESDIARFCERYGFHNFHGQTMRAGGYTIAGLGYSNPTPFNTPGEYTEERCANSSSASNRNTSSAGTSTKPWGHRSRWGSRRRTTW